MKTYFLFIRSSTRSAYSELCHIITIRHLLSVDSTKTLVSAFSLSRSDYCNSLLSRCPKQLIEKLQKVQNSAARLKNSKLINEIMFHPSSEFFTGCPSKHVSSISCQHSHSFFSDTAPVYLSDLLRVYSPSRQLRSSSDLRTLRIPHIKTKTFGHRSLFCVASSVWNSLPREIRHIQSTIAFRTAFKTHLFKSYL